MVAERAYHPVLSNAEALRIFQLMKWAADIVFIYAKPVTRPPQSGPAMLDYRAHSEPKGYVQTTGGLYLNDDFTAMWTPWGCWLIGGNPSNWTPETTFSILSRFQATRVHQPYSDVLNLLSGGKAYALTAIEGVELPSPELLPPDEIPHYYDVMRPAWRRVKEAASELS